MVHATQTARMEETFRWLDCNAPTPSRISFPLLRTETHNLWTPVYTAHTQIHTPLSPYKYQNICVGENERTVTDYFHYASVILNPFRACRWSSCPCKVYKISIHFWQNTHTYTDVWDTPGFFWFYISPKMANLFPGHMSYIQQRGKGYRLTGDTVTDA